MKCRGTSPKIVIDGHEVVLLESHSTEDDNANNEEIVYDTQPTENYHNHMVDHQYVAYDCNQTSQDAQLEDFTKKEMDVFDYIGIEIKNIQEQEDREKLLQKQNEMTEFESVQELDEADQIFDESCDEVKIENENEKFAIERVFNDANEDDELSNYVDVVNDSNFSCKLCPKIYQKKNITVKHLRSEHQIVLQNYNYDNSNRYRKPQKELDWRCQFCPRKYTSKRLVERHEKVHGPDGSRLHKCSCCLLYFPTLDEMETHQYSEHKDRLVCKVENCTKRFDHPEKLVSHTKYAHSNKKGSMKKYNFVCQLCGKSHVQFLKFHFLKILP